MRHCTPLLIPGNMCDAQMWRFGGTAIEAMLEQSFGQPPVHVDTRNGASLAEMASRALDETQGAVVAIGFSMGAIVALEMGALAPDRVRGLVLCAYNAGSDLAARSPHRLRQQETVLSGGLDRIIIDELKPVYLAPANRTNEALQSEILSMARRLGAEVFVTQSEALRSRPDRIAALTGLACPVLFIAGEHDTICPIEWHERWAELTPRSTLKSVPGAGHMIPMEAPHAFSRAIELWIADCRERYPTWPNES